MNIEKKKELILWSDTHFKHFVENRKKGIGTLF